LTLLAASLLSGCATQYQSEGLTGGLLPDRTVAKLEMVSFSANGYTSSELTQAYALYRCAELTRAKNKPFFIVYPSLAHAAHNVAGQQPRVGSVQNKPTATAFLLMLDGPAPGARNTQHVLDDLKPSIDAGSLVY
jgi:hypothetical protein